MSHLEFTQLEFHEHYVLSRPREGVILEEKHINKLLKVCLEHYGDKPFVYLSLRQQSYNVNPVIYLNLEKIRNLAGIAIVCSRISSVNNAHFEKRFSKVPFEIFMDIEEAREWAEERFKEIKKADL